MLGLTITDSLMKTAAVAGLVGVTAVAIESISHDCKEKKAIKAEEAAVVIDQVLSEKEPEITEEPEPEAEPDKQVNISNTVEAVVEDADDQKVEAEELPPEQVENVPDKEDDIVVENPQEVKQEAAPVVEEKAEQVQEAPVDEKTESISMDREKLKEILIAAHYPANNVDAFIAYIEKNAVPVEEQHATDSTEAAAPTEEKKPDQEEVKAPMFTKVEEPEVKQPDLKAKPVKKATKKTTKANNKEDK